MKFSNFYAHKDDIVEPSCKELHKWKQAGIVVKFIRCDNAGENKSLQKHLQSADWKLNVNFEFAARDTPQQNHLAELGFTVLRNRGRAIMHTASIPQNCCNKVFALAFQMATMLDWLTVIKIGNHEGTQVEFFMGKICPSPPHLWRSRHSENCKKNKPQFQ